jgi:putative PIN family toxin of toxin-antitoxin system
MTSRRPWRVVLDTNVIIAAHKSNNPQSPTVELLDRWANREFILLYSDDLLAEYLEKLTFHSVALNVRKKLIATLFRNAELIKVSDKQIHPVINADPEDDIVVACAVVGKATHLVTYGPHILDAAEHVKGIVVVDSLGFLRLLRGELK